jgi:DNA-binding transcriptional regulator YdaS (Cro superfamily)
MHLEDHLKDSGQSQAAFGGRLTPPASQGLVSQWVRGMTRVTLDYALQIEQESNGAVSPQDCADMFIDPARRTTSTPITPPISPGATP